jgi:hypothetical protein
MHEPDFGHALALTTPRGGAGWIDVHPLDISRAAKDEVHHSRIVDGGVGVGLQHHRGDPALRRRAAGRFQRLFGFRPRLAGLHAQVDQAWDQNGAPRVDHGHVG